MDNFAIARQLKCCMSLTQVKQVHGQLKRMGPEAEAILGNALFESYLKLGSTGDAYDIFFRMPTRDTISWTRLIARYVQQGSDEAILLFRKMLLQGSKPDTVTFVTVLGAFTTPADLEQFRNLHAWISETGEDESNVVVGNALVSTYAKCESLREARNAFEKILVRDLVSWTALLTGYVQNGLESEALEVFKQMQLEGVKPDGVTLITVLSACASSQSLADARRIEMCACEMGLSYDVVVGNALLDVYVKCGSLEDVSEAFEAMEARTVVSWNAMISAYAQRGHADVFLHLSRMQLEGMGLDKFTLVTMLDACANLTLLAEGRRIHRLVQDKGLEADTVVSNALINMYGKCGSLRDAVGAFDRMQRRDLLSWTSITSACAQHGEGEKALKLFLLMQQAGVKPDRVTFSSVLYACSHVGLVDRGCQYFGSMPGEYGLSPELDQHLVMVDILGRAGKLELAESCIAKVEETDTEASGQMWMSLLSACKIHKDQERGKRAAEQVIRLNPRYTPAYVILSSIYSAAGNWVEAAKVKRQMLENGAAKKERGHSWIYVKNKVHLFVERDRSHPQTEMIYGELQRLNRVMREAGYVPDKAWVMQDVDEEQKEHLLCYHSEKLAVAFGILSTPCKSELLVIKNLRVCGDCHSALKWISKIEGRHLVVRDAHRFHHFDGGKCSCGDYW